MNAVVELVFLPRCKIERGRGIGAWARSPDAEIVVHTIVRWPDERPSDVWTASHRRSGLRLNLLRFVDRATALAFTEVLGDLPWADIPGQAGDAVPKWQTTAAATDLRAEVEKRYTRFCQVQRETVGLIPGRAPL